MKNINLKYYVMLGIVLLAEIIFFVYAGTGILSIVMTIGLQSIVFFCAKYFSHLAIAIALLAPIGYCNNPLTLTFTAIAILVLGLIGLYSAKKTAGTGKSGA